MAIGGANNGSTTGGFGAFNPQNAPSGFSNRDIQSALNIPDYVTGGQSIGPIDVNGMVPALGDQTGATRYATNLAGAGIYSQLQRVLSTINWLNTAPEGVQPNPNFSYIPGRPPYGQDTVEGQREQAKVFAALRTTIIAQLVKIADQLRTAYSGLKQQETLAETFGKEQTSTIKKWAESPFQG